jgi:tetratricopeptide (TPR) repeat protein
MKDISIKQKFSIVQVSPMASMGIGDYVYRIAQPAEAMGRVPGIMVINLTAISPYLKEISVGADLLVLHLIGEMDMLPIVAERKRRGLATVYEISDNFMAFPPWANIKLWFNDPVNLATTFQLIRLSDAVQGVSEVLLEKFGFLHERRRVFENQIMEMGPIPRIPGEELVIGWGGSLGHTEDIQEIVPVIQGICRKYPHVRFAFMGNREQYEQVFGSVANDQFYYREPGDLSDYYNFLDGLDIGIAPLLDTAYNICRSDVKFIEYASRGVVPVVSDVDPYKKHTRHGVNAFLFESPESLGNVLEMLVKDKYLMQGVKENAYEYVKKERMEKARVTERISFYQELAQSRSAVPLPLNLLQRSSPGTEVYHPIQTPAEGKVIKGAYAEADGHLQKARGLLLEAARDLPGYSFPLLWVGRSLMKEDGAKAIDYLHQSLSINPESLRARLLLGQVLKHENRKAACKEFEKALQVFPDFAPAWKEIGLLEKEEARLDEAAILMNKALEANPFYAAAASELGKIYREQKKMDLALQALRVSVNLIPDNLDYQTSVIEALIEVGNLDEALRECIEYLNGSPRSGQMYSILARILAAQGKEQEASDAREMAARYT